MSGGAFSSVSGSNEDVDYRIKKLGQSPSDRIIEMVRAANDARLSRNYDLALRILKVVIEENPKITAVLTIRAVLYIQIGDDAQAEQDFRAILRLNSGHIDSWLGLGHILMRRHAYGDAHTCFSSADRLRPGDAQTQLKLGEVVRNLGQVSLALKYFKKAVLFSPILVPAYVAMIRQAVDAGKLSLFERMERWITLIDPLNAEALSTFGLVMVDNTKSLAAQKYFKQACCSNPLNITALSGFAGLCSSLFAPEKATQLYSRIRQVSPESITLKSPLMMLLHYDPFMKLESIGQFTHEAANKSVPSGPEWQPRAERHTNERLRVGLISFNLSNHPEGFFIRPFLQNYDKTVLDVFLYHTGAKKDFVSDELKSYADTWLDCQNFSDRDLTERIRADELDIIVDLTGLANGSHDGVLANRVAPIQVGWIGFFGTYGLGTMDYLIVDRQTVPLDMDAYFSEKIWAIEDNYICYLPPDQIKNHNFAGPPERAEVVFANFNKLAKTNDLMIKQWSRILRRVPNGILEFKSKWLEDEAVQVALKAAFKANGVTADQLRFKPAQGHLEHLLSYGSVDIALDPTPFGGGTTTLDALWTGTPLITLRGNRWAGRVSASFLSLIGRGDLIADTLDEYVEIAVALAQDSIRRRDLRSDIQRAFRASPAMDAPSFARKMEKIFQDMVAVAD